MISEEPADPSEETALRERYFKNCRRRVGPFVRRHFRYPGAWRSNRRALGWDLVRAPLNLFWAPVYVLCQLLGWLLTQGGAHRWGRVLRGTPSGLTTDVQRYLNGRIEEELLVLRPEDSQLTQLGRAALGHYGSTRTAAADIGNSVGSTLLGAFAYKQFTPGGIALGLLVTTWLAQRRASQEFWFGEALGNWFYGLFPPTPSTGELFLGIGLTLTALAISATLSGLLLDPLQARLGLHERRLQRMLTQLQEDLGAVDHSRYRPRDPLLARLLDAVDAVRSQLP